VFGHAGCNSFSMQFCAAFATRRWPQLQLDDVIIHRISYNSSVYLALLGTELLSFGLFVIG